ncbi:sulfotransferase family protein [Micromonospora sp. NPDC050397]|uniref:sulfotransferase family protein n=1 Tax=Micromonospora sp. NPDC050397 TaxID=3364279 RepID=UPI00384E72CA
MGGSDVLEIIGAGFGRTGTMSTKEALELLGFGPCHHMTELFRQPASIAGWLRVAEGGPADWDSLYAGYRSTLDWPGAYFWRDLVATYPDARVLLTVRDPDRWYDSVASTIYRPRSSDPSTLSPAVRRATEERPELLDQPRLAEKLVWQGTFGGRFADRAHAIGVYTAHLAEVRATVPAGRLLEFDPAQGWEPLCSWLGVDPPDTPFPLLNTGESFRERIADPDGLRGL